MLKKKPETKPETLEKEVDQEVEEVSKGKDILNTVVNVFLVVAIVLAAMCTYASYVSSSGNGVPSIFGIRIFSIQTESMYPTLLPGDMVVGTAVKDTKELQVGDIITYWTVISGERVLNTHRISIHYILRLQIGIGKRRSHRRFCTFAFGIGSRQMVSIGAFPHSQKRDLAAVAIH